MKSNNISCNEKGQALWAGYYIAAAERLCSAFDVRGRAALRDAIRMYAAIKGEKRLEFLLAHGRKPNLRNLFCQGGPFPCGPGCVKEWIRVTSQEVFVNVANCPYADMWNGMGKSELGKIFCEEYYPAYISAAASDKAQINMGRILVNEGDTFCRLSIYLRPANLSEAQREFFFEEFDCSYEEPAAPFPDEPVNFKDDIRILHDCLVKCAALHVGNAGADLINNLYQSQVGGTYE